MTFDKIKALLAALPAQLAAVQSVLTVIATEVVPQLPDNAAVRVAAWCALAAGWVATAIAAVSRVTPVPDEARGLVLEAGQLDVEHRTATGRLTGAIVTRAAEA